MTEIAVGQDGAQVARYISQRIGGASLGVAAILAAVTDTGVEQTISTGFNPLDRPRRITATAGGTSGDIKAIQVTVVGEDVDGNTISDALPAFTVNTPGTVIGTKVFNKVTSVTIPAHDGVAATTSLGADGLPNAGATGAILAAVTDNGAAQVFDNDPDSAGESLVNQPDVARVLTATAGGTSGDIAAVSVVVAGEDINGAPISETLPAFTVNTPGTVTGVKAFRKVTSVTIPAHDGVAATTAVGTGDALGLGHALPRNTVKASYLNNVLEEDSAGSVGPTVVVDVDEVEKNVATLESALNQTPVEIEYVLTD